jgi:hypothetical protein
MIEKPNATCICVSRHWEHPSYSNTHQTMEQGVRDPHPERGLGEEDVPLPEHVQLRVAVEDAGRHELVEDADDEWGQDREYNVV